MYVQAGLGGPDPEREAAILEMLQQHELIRTGQLPLTETLRMQWYQKLLQLQELALHPEHAPDDRVYWLRVAERYRQLMETAGGESRTP